MDEVLLESPLQSKPPIFSPQFDANHQTLLKESIDRFLVEFSKGIRDFSSFRSIFFRLLQSGSNPPLEIIWFYSALSFHGSESSKDGAFGRVLISKDLFQHLSAFSADLDGVKSIALLAPVLFKLHLSVIELISPGGQSRKSGKKLTREIECLLEGILGYLGICSTSCSRSCGDLNALSADLLPCFGDLVRVWMVDRVGGKWKVKEGLRLFFPLVSDDILSGFWEEKCGSQYLAAVVILEAFLLRLCLRIRGGVSKPELQKELKIWAVASITAFRNSVFFEMLLRMLLLEPTLPITSLLSAEDEVFLREILYDAVILVDYSFITPKLADGHYDDEMKSLSVTWLIAAHEIVQNARAKGDQAKAISYINAYSSSQLPSKLIKWVTSHTGIEKSSIPSVSTPQALLKWLLTLEERGLCVFVNGVSKFCSKLVFDDSKMDCGLPNLNSTKADDDLFFIDKKGQQSDNSIDGDHPMQSMDAVFLSAAQTMKFTANDARRKRKEDGMTEEKKQVKFQRYKLHDISADENTGLSAADDISGSELENPPSDDDMAEMEQ